MHEHHPILQKLGLNEKEVKLYLTLLELGSASVRQLSAVSRINRGTAYDILKKLRKRGLATVYNKEDQKYFSAADPERLESLIGERQVELSSLADNLRRLIPELQSIYNEGGGKPVARFYEGEAGVRALLDDVLSSLRALSEEAREYYVYSSVSVRDELHRIYPDYNPRRIAQKIYVKTISLGPGGELVGLDERKWIQKAVDSLTYILIYNGKCGMISYDASGNLVGVIIDNDGIYETQKLIFAQLWSLLKIKPLRAV